MIGIIYGSGFFTSSIVIGLIIKNSKNKILIDKSNLNRDLGYLLIGHIFF